MPISSNILPHSSRRTPPFASPLVLPRVFSPELSRASPKALTSALLKRKRFELVFTPKTRTGTSQLVPAVRGATGEELKAGFKQTIRELKQIERRRPEEFEKKSQRFKPVFWMWFVNDVAEHARPKNPWLFQMGKENNFHYIGKEAEQKIKDLIAEHPSKKNKILKSIEKDMAELFFYTAVNVEEFFLVRHKGAGYNFPFTAAFFDHEAYGAKAGIKLHFAEINYIIEKLRAEQTP